MLYLLGYPLKPRLQILLKFKGECIEVASIRYVKLRLYIVVSMNWKEYTKVIVQLASVLYFGLLDNDNFDRVPLVNKSLKTFYL